MARIAGVDLPNNKSVELALTSIYGIGRISSRQIIKSVRVNGTVKLKELTDEDINRLRLVVEGRYKVEGQLRQEIRTNIRRLKRIKSWRGARHERHLPVRGQNTRSNSRTVRGNVRLTASGTSARRSQPSPT